MNPRANGGESVLLEADKLTIQFGGLRAVDQVSFAVKPGEVYTIVGPNGAGKTTVFNLISRIYDVTDGRIVFEGADITAVPAHRIARMGIALVPENRLVFPSMSVLENLHAGAYQRGDKKTVAEDIERMFARFPRLKERSAQLAGTLSGGEQQMLAVARALMSRPKLLLMDEPSLGLAPLVVEEIFRIVTDLHRDGATILLVEQNAHMALKVAHHFFLIEQGRISFSGTPGALAEDEVIRRAYLGSSKA